MKFQPFDSINPNFNNQISFSLQVGCPTNGAMKVRSYGYYTILSRVLSALDLTPSAHYNLSRMRFKRTLWSLPTDKLLISCSSRTSRMTLLARLRQTRCTLLYQRINCLLNTPKRFGIRIFDSLEFITNSYSKGRSIERFPKCNLHATFIRDFKESHYCSWLWVTCDFIRESTTLFTKLQCTPTQPNDRSPAWKYWTQKRPCK